jgi:putative transposase
MSTLSEKTMIRAQIRLYLQRPVEPEHLSWNEVGRILHDISFETVLGLNHAITECHLFERDRSKHWRETGENLPPNSLYSRIYADTRELMKTAASGMASTIVRTAVTRYRNSSKDIRSFRQSVPSYRLGHPILLREGGGETKIWSDGGLYFFRAAFQNRNYSPTRIAFLLDTFKLAKSRKVILDQIISGGYKLGACQVAQDSRKRWFVRIVYGFPKTESKPDSTVCIGVNLGLSFPFCCAVNNGFRKLQCNEAMIIKNFRRQIVKRKSVFQSCLKYSTRAGHGKTKAMAPIKKLIEKERNFRLTKYHQYTSRIMDFAISNNAGVIQIEKLDHVIESPKKILKDWAVSEFYQKLKYKAEHSGIEVREIGASSAYLQCSECGNVNEAESSDQSDFRCSTCSYEAHVDYNTARNIARMRSG